MGIFDKKLSFAIVCNLKRRDCYVQNFLEFKEFEGGKRHENQDDLELA